ncbi:MAG: hypothetical protein IIB08_09230 [Bacteroidetes bacterium]|nr:hypothetical protein [Bacteroidota bacterium]
MKLSEKIHKAHIEFDIDKRKEFGYVITYNQIEKLENLEKQAEGLKEDRLKLVGIRILLEIKEEEITSLEKQMKEYERN